LEEIRGGIQEIEQLLDVQGESGPEECEELKFLRNWEKEVEGNRPLSRREKLDADLRAAVEDEKFELAASLRDKLRRLRD
ncbi:MAG: UvrB/UvrC motif-containing protein, partial [Gemmatimonadetes bacterium]|nr:UvrB/UvrC motif-containing protein [Gemmatimonadota bacterium]